MYLSDSVAFRQGRNRTAGPGRRPPVWGRDAGLCLERVEDGSRAPRGRGARGGRRGAGGGERSRAAPGWAGGPGRPRVGLRVRVRLAGGPRPCLPALRDPSTRPRWAGRSFPQPALTAWWSLCVEAPGPTRQSGQRRAGGAATQHQGEPAGQRPGHKAVPVRAAGRALGLVEPVECARGPGRHPRLREARRLLHTSSPCPQPCQEGALERPSHAQGS